LSGGSGLGASSRSDGLVRLTDLADQVSRPWTSRDNETVLASPAILLLTIGPVVLCQDLLHHQKQSYCFGYLAFESISCASFSIDWLTRKTPIDISISHYGESAAATLVSGLRQSRLPIVVAVAHARRLRSGSASPVCHASSVGISQVQAADLSQARSCQTY